MTKNHLIRDSAVMISSTMPFGEILLLGVAADVLERQDRDRRLVGQREQCWCCLGHHRTLFLFRLERDAIDVHRPRDVLNLLLAPVLKLDVELVAYLVAHHSADTDPAGLGARFEAGGDIDAVTDMSCSSMMMSPRLIPMRNSIRRSAGTAPLRRIISRWTSTAQAHRIDDAGKLYQQTVAGRLDDAARGAPRSWGPTIRAGSAFSAASVPSSSAPISRE